MLTMFEANLPNYYKSKRKSQDLLNRVSGIDLIVFCGRDSAKIQLLRFYPKKPLIWSSCLMAPSQASSTNFKCNIHYSLIELKKFCFILSRVTVVAQIPDGTYQKNLVQKL